MPPALGRLSTTICCPQLFVISGPIMRASRSVALPAVNGTIMRIGREGYSAATALAGQQAIIIMNAHRLMRTSGSHRPKVKACLRANAITAEGSLRPVAFGAEKLLPGTLFGSPPTGFASSATAM
jgi:hypothetical protein